MKTSAVLCFLVVIVLSQPGDATEETVADVEEILDVSSLLIIIAGSFRVSLFIDLGCLGDLGTGSWHFYDK